MLTTDIYFNDVLLNFGLVLKIQFPPIQYHKMQGCEMGPFSVTRHVWNTKFQEFAMSGDILLAFDKRKYLIYPIFFLLWILV